MKKKLNVNKKSIALSIATLGILGVLSAGSFMAYLTDTDTKTNTFTIGNVDVGVDETFNPDDAKNIVPNQTVKKAPKVTNKSTTNAAIAFISVTSPKAEVQVIDDTTGAKGTAANTELFKTTTTGDTTYAYGKVNSTNWVQLTSKTVDGTDSVVRVYGYKKPVAAGESTDTIFDSVKLINVAENTSLTGNKEIVVSAYAIQATDIDGVTISEDMDETTLASIYDTYVKQNPTA